MRIAYVKPIMAPYNKCLALLALLLGSISTVATLDNCEPLSSEGVQLSWSLDLANSVATFQLCGCTGAGKQYLGFGLSGSTTATLMRGADPIISWVDQEGAHASDYHLSDYIQCRNGLGACPDTLRTGNCVDNVLNVSGSMQDGLQCITFSRKFDTGDSECDKVIDPGNVSQYVVWGVGALGQTAFKHFKRASAGDPPLHFGRTPVDNCNTVLNCTVCPTFEPNTIVAPDNTVFRAQIGPSGEDRGYQAITGLPGWGIAWWVNGMLIPELVVQRGSTYTFLVEGGNDVTKLGEYHPLYITDSPSGGRTFNSKDDRDAEVVFAGYDEFGRPLAEGHYCELKELSDATNVLKTCGSLQDYSSLLKLECEESGGPATLMWTPNDCTPDTVYYQCGTHLNLGWKISVTGGNPFACSATGHSVFSAVGLTVMVATLWFAFQSLDL